MQTIKSFEGILYEVNEDNFENIALEVFKLQADQNPVYREYLTHLGVTPKDIRLVTEIPFLPISFFKNAEIKTGNWQPMLEFTSSGTTGNTMSRHLVKDLDFYLANTLKIFEHFYGKPSHYHFLALLPSYMGREDSSLIAMVNYFIQQSRSTESGFFLDQLDELTSKIEALKNDNRKIILWGVSFALLDLAEQAQLDLSRVIVMETGGMKGRRSEITREELHGYLSKRFNTSSIHSEYGMTELFSQAYSSQKGYFQTPDWMKVVIRDMNDPFSTVENGQAGSLNIIDLANLYSCCFIETQDLGRLHQDGSFEVLGRLDNSDRRGCNLLVER